MSAPQIDQAMVLFRKRRYLPMYPAITPRGRSIRIVPIQNEMVHLRIFLNDSCVCPLVRYPINPMQRTLLQGQMPAMRPKMKMPRAEGSNVAIFSCLH
jgi:hypothetical protein